MIHILVTRLPIKSPIEYMPYLCVLEGKKFSLFVSLGIYNEKCGFSKISEGEYQPWVVGN